MLYRISGYVMSLNTFWSSVGALPDHASATRKPSETKTLHPLCDSDAIEFGNIVGSGVHFKTFDEVCICISILKASTP